MKKHLYLVIILWISLCEPGDSIYFTHPDLILSVYVGDTLRQSVHKIQAVLEPDETGFVTYGLQSSEGRKSNATHCPSAQVDPDGTISITFTSSFTTTPSKNGTRQALNYCQYSVQDLHPSQPNLLYSIFGIRCDGYIFGAKLNGTLGMTRTEKASVKVTLNLFSLKDDKRGKDGEECGVAAEKSSCFNGLFKIDLSVMENSKMFSPVSLKRLHPGCLENKLNYFVSGNSTSTKVLSIAEEDGNAVLWVDGGLDRESIDAYIFQLVCSITSSDGKKRNYTIPGVLYVLDQDDNLPTIGSGNFSTHIASITLHSEKNSKHSTRLEPDDGHTVLMLQDRDTLAVNNITISRVNDTKNILHVFINTPYQINTHGVPSSSMILRAELRSKLITWKGSYCVQILVNDTSLVNSNGNSSITFTICLHVGGSAEAGDNDTMDEPIPGDPGARITVTTQPGARVTNETHFAPYDTCGPFCLFVSVLGSLGIILAISLAVISKYCTHRRRKKRRSDEEKNGGLHGMRAEGMSMEMNVPIYSDMDGFDGIGMQNRLEYLPVDPKWEVGRTCLILGDVIGEGEFGRVLKAKFKHPADPQAQIIDAAVKMLKDVDNGSGKSSRQEFYAEFSLLKQVDHHNVIKLLGVCTSAGGPSYLIMEYAEYKSLRSFLRKCRHIESVPPRSPSPGPDSGLEMDTNPRIFVEGMEWDPAYTVTPREILGFSWQVAKGMAYLSDMKMVHRDLAARNVLLTQEKVCKISDFGLTRDVYVDDAYKKKSKDRVPVKWLAPECLADELYTSKSDVWAYGILLWELSNMGASPYPGIPSEQLYSLLKSGYRMAQPANCQFQFYGLMRQCWADDPANRPTFRQLVADLGSLLEDGIDYIQLNIPSVSNPVYDCQNLGVFATNSAAPETRAQQQTSQVLYTLTETSSDQASPSSSMENLRLIDHEISAFEDMGLSQNSAVSGTGAKEYKNGFVHFYTNNDRDRHGCGVSNGFSQSHPVGAKSDPNSAYESPIKLKA